MPRNPKHSRKATPRKQLKNKKTIITKAQGKRINRATQRVERIEKIWNGEFETAYKSLNPEEISKAIKTGKLFLRATKESVVAQSAIIKASDKNIDMMLSVLEKKEAKNIRFLLGLRDIILRRLETKRTDIPEQERYILFQNYMGRIVMLVTKAEIEMLKRRLVEVQSQMN